MAFVAILFTVSGILLKSAFTPFQMPVMMVFPSPSQFTAPITDIMADTIFGNSAIRFGIFCMIPVSNFLIIFAPANRIFGRFSLIISATFLTMVGTYAMRSGSATISPSTML